MKLKLNQWSLKRIKTLCGFLALSCSAANAQNITQSQTDNLIKTIEEIRVAHRVPAIGITIIQPNHSYTHAFGYTNKETNKAATTESLFRFGSITKMLPGIAILQLQEQGKLQLTDNLRDIVPEFSFENDWHESHPVQIQHLLEHTTGWDNHPGEQKIFEHDQTSLKEVLAIYPQSRVSRWVPGTRSAYSNTGPTVAAYVVEELTGMSFSDYVKEHIFQPLGMENSHLLKPENWQSEAVMPYLNNGMAAGYEHIATRPASSLTASMTDMNKLLSLFINPTGSGVLSADSVSRMQRIESELAHKAGVVSYQGFVHSKDIINGEVFYGHNGGIPGAISAFRYHPQSQTGFVFALNKVSGAAFSKIKTALAEHLGHLPQTHTPKSLPIDGSFSDADGMYVKLNTGNKIGDLVSYFSNAAEVSVNDESVNFKWFGNGYEITYYQKEPGAMLYNKYGSPQLTFAQDPIAGKVLLRNAEVYKQVPLWLFYAKLTALVASLVVIFTSIFYTLYGFVLRPIIKGLKKESMQLALPRVVACMASAVLMIAVLPILIVGEYGLINNLYWISPLMTFSSCVYPLMAIIGAVIFIKNYTMVNKWFHRGYLGSIVLAHMVLAIFLIRYQLVAISLAA